MRSVVVVLPASMCAMMPMLRTLFRSVSTSFCATEVSLFRLLGCCCRHARRPARWMSPLGGSGHRRRLSPAVVSEGPVRLGHFVGVFPSLDGGTQAIAGVENLIGQTLDHCLFTPLLGEADQPTQGQRHRPIRPNLDRNLIGGATDPAATHLERRLDVVQSALEGDDRIGAGLVTGLLERTINNAFGQ